MPNKTHTPEQLRDKIINLIEAAGYEPRSYSGRGMYGKQCLGVDLPKIAHLVKLGGVPLPTTDSMGLGIIAYWPNVPPPEDENPMGLSDEELEDADPNGGPECAECGMAIPPRQGGGLECRHHRESCSLWADED